MQGQWPAASHSSWDPAAESASKYAVVALVRPHVSDLRGLSSFISGWTVWLCSFKKQSSRGTGGHSQKSVRAFSNE